jgi:quinolinate synthase
MLSIRPVSQHPESLAQADLAIRYEHLYRLAMSVMPEAEWYAHLPLIAAIDELKTARAAIVLAHHYQTPDIYYGVADFRGDSLALARYAAESSADVVVVCGVRFMAETAKLLSPEKTVLLPSPEAGCSLAASITAQDVRELRRRYPGVPVVCYVNTSAAVKAECDLCCTSANAVEAVESLGADPVILVPDEYLARYVSARTNVRIIPWTGHCEVHERFTGKELAEYRAATGAYVLAHPECPQDVQVSADYVGSTSGMIQELATRKPRRALLLTECSMSDNVAVAHPDIDFVRPCNLCPHMKRVTLENIRDCLENLAPAVEVDDACIERARLSLLAMLDVKSA